MVYFYAPDRRGENGEKFLTGFNGILQIDGYTGYNRLTKSSRKGGDPITVAYCWAHARRKLKEIFDRDGSEIAAEGLRQISEIYAIEKDIRSTSPKPDLRPWWLHSGNGLRRSVCGSQPSHASARNWPISIVIGADCKPS